MDQRQGEYCFIACVCQTRVEVKRQPAEVSFCFPPNGSQEWTQVAWQLASLPAQLSPACERVFSVCVHMCVHAHIYYGARVEAEDTWKECVLSFHHESGSDLVATSFLGL